MLFFKKVTEDIVLFVVAILLYVILIALIFPNPEVGRFGATRELVLSIFSGEIFSFHGFFVVLVLFVGIPPLIVRWVSGLLSNKLNFILLPILIVITLLFMLPLIYLIIFETGAVAPTRLGQILSFYAITATVFQVGFGFVVAGLRMWERKRHTFLAQ